MARKKKQKARYVLQEESDEGASVRKTNEEVDEIVSSMHGQMEGMEDDEFAQKKILLWIIEWAAKHHLHKLISGFLSLISYIHLSYLRERRIQRAAFARWEYWETS